MHWHGDAWNALAFGEKHWLLEPPASARFSKVHRPSDHGDADQSGNAMPQSPSLPLHRCKQRPGDVLFVPNGWGHAVLNTGAGWSAGVAVEFRYSFSFFA